MTLSLFDIIRHKVAVWVVFPLLVVLSVAMYQYAFYTPAAVALEINRAQLNSLRYSPATQEQTPLEEFGSTLQSVKELTNLTLTSVDNYQEHEVGLGDQLLGLIGIQTDTGASLTELTEKLDRIIELETVAMASFDDMYGYLIGIDADEVIFERHNAAVQTFNDGMAPIKSIRDQLQNAKTLSEQQALLTELNDYLEKQQFKKTHTAEDFENGSLPFGPRNQQAREPLLDLSSIEANFFDSVDVATNVLTQDILRGLVAPSALPNVEDLAETEEAPQTQAIIDLAASLKNDPIEIYNWVYNNIYSIPSYGAIQGAQYTLDLKAGNPFDTSALLLALLRAAGTPARYAYGTVEVPIDQVMNWVGGAEVPEAATNVMLQGGIPTKLVIDYTGQIATAKFEHIWVEAWVDFEPSRGLVNVEGDHWIPMDAAFKQYDYDDGADFQSEVPFDAQGLIDSLATQATIDETNGYIQDLDELILDQAFESYSSQIDSFLSGFDQNNLLDEVLVTKNVPIRARSPLSPGLPYQVIDRSSQIQKIPDTFKHKFRVQLDYDVWGNKAIDKTINTVSLAGKDIFISFEPASQSDLDLVASYSPDVELGEVVDYSTIATQLPGYLINVKPELAIGNEIITASGGVAIGSELHSVYSLYNPSFGWNQSKNKPVAGEFIAVGLDLQGISDIHKETLINRVQQVTADILANQAENFNKYEVFGPKFQTAIIGYFAMNDAQDDHDKKVSNQLYFRAPSYGQFGTSLQTQYWFGIPRNVSSPGVIMDVDSLASIGSDKWNDEGARRQFNQGIGLRMSYFENWIPELLFSTETQKLQGISATKALVLANQEGQRIYEIDLSNVNQLSNITIDSGAYSEIRSSVYSGNKVIVHENPLNYNGWTGSGYVILDKDTGAGAYKITGGQNGAALVAIGMLLILLGALNPGIGVFIAALGLLLIGCGLSMIFGDTRYFEASMWAVTLVMGFIASIATSGGAGFAMVVAGFDLAIIIAGVSASCAAGF